MIIVIFHWWMKQFTKSHFPVISIAVWIPPQVTDKKETLITYSI